MNAPEAFDAVMVDLYRRNAAVMPSGTQWFDAHTHTGQNDPDGMKATADEILAGLDVVGHSQALVFTTMEPDGYPAANDRVIAEAAGSGGRLHALARLDPHDSPRAEAERCLDAGAVGLKLHPRAEHFALHDNGIEDIVRLADERRLPIIIHAGRGIPALGRDTVELATRYPGARLILAHAGISDLAWIWREAEHLPNLFFDTAWWLVADLLALFAHVPPGHILYASDMPYGHPVFNGLALIRCGLAVGLAPDVLAQIAGGSPGAPDGRGGAPRPGPGSGSAQGRAAGQRATRRPAPRGRGLAGDGRRRPDGAARPRPPLVRGAGRRSRARAAGARGAPDRHRRVACGRSSAVAPAGGWAIRCRGADRGHAVRACVMARTQA